MAALAQTQLHTISVFDIGPVIWLYIEKLQFIFSVERPLLSALVTPLSNAIHLCWWGYKSCLQPYWLYDHGNYWCTKANAVGYRS